MTEMLSLSNSPLLFVTAMLVKILVVFGVYFLFRTASRQSENHQLS